MHFEAAAMRAYPLAHARGSTRKLAAPRRNSPLHAEARASGVAWYKTSQQMNQLVTPEVAPAPIEPIRDVMPSTGPEEGEPREWNVVSRYLPDSSLRYTTLRVGGSTLRRFIVLALLGALCVAAVVIPVWRLAVHHVVFLSSLSVFPGAFGCVVLFRPLLVSAREARTRFFFLRTLRNIGLGLDRAVFQPGNTFRYEVHLPAIGPVDLLEVRFRLVFWESWTERVTLPWVRWRRWALQKQGHDLVAQTAMAIPLVRGQHGVVRGEIRVPQNRPTEHHRGKRKHVSYVNLTVTLVAADRSKTPIFTGDCPHLITFPWM